MFLPEECIGDYRAKPAHDYFHFSNVSATPLLSATTAAAPSQINTIILSKIMHILQIIKHLIHVHLLSFHSSKALMGKSNETAVCQYLQPQ